MKVGLQVYTVRNHLKESPEKTLKSVVEAGYKGIEFANHFADKDIGIGFGYSVEEMKRIVNDLCITVVGAHIMTGDDNFDIYAKPDHYKKIIDYYLELGASFLSIPIFFYPTLDDLKRKCEDFNCIGKLCKENGIQLLYHNHWNEYQLMDGVTIFDHLMQNTDPEYLGIELDTFWTIRGLVDPVDMLNQYGTRIKLLHQKDFPLAKIDELNSWKVVDRSKIVTREEFNSTVHPEHFTEVGKGIMKIQDIIDTGNQYGIPYILVEQDYSTLDEIESINVSMSSFRKMRGLELE